jgi:hypothetical protein
LKEDKAPTFSQNMWGILGLWPLGRGAGVRDEGGTAWILQGLVLGGRVLGSGAVGTQSGHMWGRVGRPAQGRGEARAPIPTTLRDEAGVGALSLYTVFCF